jgi:hypothetical protein
MNSVERVQVFGRPPMLRAAQLGFHCVGVVRVRTELRSEVRQYECRSARAESGRRS